MLLFTSLEASGSSPPPTAEDVIMDFVNGIYTVGATSYSLADAIDHTDLVDSGGLQVPAAQSYAISVLSPFSHVALLSVAWTCVVEFSFPVTSTTPNLVVVQSDDEYDSTDGAAVYLAWSNFNVPAEKMYLDVWTGDFDYFESAFGGSIVGPSTDVHKVAFNYSLGGHAVSLDGQAVGSISSPHAAPPLTRVLLGSEVSAIAYGGGVTQDQITIRKVTFYAVQRPDSDLPGLSS